MNPERIDNYRIDGLLGEGGMGRVYRAWDDDLERAVAIKVIRSNASASSDGKERFRREAKVVASLDHPNLVHIYRLLEWRGHDAIVMELVGGETLSQRLKQGPLPLGLVLRLGREIADGLATAHRQGVVHRDLKSANVMVSRDGRAKILDFGLAKRLALDDEATVAESFTVEGSVLGTFHAMAPEQALGQEVDHRADLFALGVLLYEMLSARSPFRGQNAKETLARVLGARQRPLDALDPEIPRTVSVLVDRLLNKDPADRPESADEVVDSLARLAVELGYDSGVPTHPLAEIVGETAAVDEEGTASPGPATAAGDSGELDAIATAGISPATKVPARRWTPVVGLVALVLGILLSVVYLRTEDPPSPLDKAREHWLAFDPVETLAELRSIAYSERVDPGETDGEGGDSGQVIDGPPDALLLAAEAWFELGQIENARAAIERASEQGVSKDQQLLAAGLGAELDGEYQAAAELYRQYRDRSPEDPATAIRLVRAALRIPGPGLSEMVENTIQDYSRLAPEDPLSWYLMAHVTDLVGHGAMALEAADDVIERTTGDLLEARAQMIRGSALEALGRVEEGGEALDRAQRLFERWGDRRGEAQIEELRAFEGNNPPPETTRAHLEKALAWHIENQDFRSQARVSGHLGTLARRQGDYAATEQYSRQATEAFRRLGAFREAVATLNEQGAAALVAGELWVAERLLVEARELAEQTRHADGQLIIEINLGEVYYARGMLDSAAKTFGKALADTQSLQRVEDEGYVYSWLGRVAMLSDTGSWEEVERLLQKAAQLQKDHDPGSRPDTLLALAEHASWLALSRPSESAEQEVETRLATLELAVSGSLALSAKLLRARHLVVAGGEEEARAALEPIPDPDENGVEASKVRGWAAALRGEDVTPALRELDVLATEAMDHDAVVAAFEARLAAAEIARVAGLSEGETRLKTLLAELEETELQGLAWRTRTLLVRTRR